MRRTLCGFLLLLALCLVPSSVYAAGGESGWGWLETAGRWVNLAVLFGLIFYFVRQPMKKFFSNRRKEIQAELSAAKKAQAEAEAQLEQVQAKLAGLDQELALLKAQAEAEGEQERKRLLAEAEAEGAKIIAAARREIDGLTKTAQQDLREYAVKLSVDLARERISKEMDSDAEGHIIDRFIVKMKSDSGGES
ncbi:MAG: F0F1 ATP synthase subunit B [Acidobacteriota bacterium]|nr:MAG: F0F1 ATP synthase subunit B [Acidobacteriota bacterium]